MKKVLSIIMALMLMLSIAGCGSEVNDTDVSQNGTGSGANTSEVDDSFYGFRVSGSKLLDANGNELPKTVVSREYSSEWKVGDEPYYPVNDEKNGALYAEYKKLADAETNIIFGGRLGEYKYYDMDAVIASALAMAEAELV